jgi:beta-aspartyl-peptidase (threonine type)
MPQPAIVVHGGVASPESPPRHEEPYRAGLHEAVLAARAVLDEGGAAVDAAQAAVVALEANPRFNAGRGSVLNDEGGVEMDAAIMCGRTGKAGAVAAVSRVEHPVLLARAVMERTPHVLLAGPGAERFAREAGMRMVPSDFHVTERQRERWLRAHEAGAPKGTVGAVVLDPAGNLAAATSTGGIARKLPGRVGDSPLIGAGTYAENGVCAVSATGDGEHILRAVAAHEVSRLVAYRELGVAEACRAVIDERVGPAGGEIGLIALDMTGEAALASNATVFHRGFQLGDGPIETAVRQAQS